MITSACVSPTMHALAHRHSRTVAFVLALVAASASWAQGASAARRAEPPREAWLSRDDVRAFITEMSTEHGFAAREIERWLAAAKFQPKVVELMSRPIVEPPKWFEYAPQFLAPARVEAGVAFWNANKEALARAEERTGVPAEVIVAIIGVETWYGRYTGSHRVIDALATLAFDYPRRATFFRGELREFLLLAREQGFSPLSPKGSFAGAMGLPQFMPGSYRRYALDFDRPWTVDRRGLRTKAGWSPCASPFMPTTARVRIERTTAASPASSARASNAASLSSPARSRNARR